MVSKPTGSIVSRTIVHLSDLHIGHSPERLRLVRSLRDRIRLLDVDHVLVTGDTTDHGREEEYRQFQDVFSEFIETQRLTVLPGNHDRTGQEIAKRIMPDQRVDIIQRDGLHLVRVDTTGPHNRCRVFSHGKIDQQIIRDIDQAVSQAVPESLVIVSLHHHLVPQPEDLWIEKLATFLSLPYARELRLGKELAQHLVGRCDLVLHGHRHKPLETHIATTPRALTIYNAGSSTELGKFRVFRYGGGRLIGNPEWC